MFQHLIYKCPKCHNTLLVSNKMLHDLRCTEDNPATYENVLRQSRIIDNYPQPSYYQDNSSQYSNSLRKSNGDGTSSDIKKSINYNGEEEYIETRYDAEGNIISRKKADNIGYEIPQNNIQEVSEFYEYEDGNEDNNIYVDNGINNNNYYIEPSVEVSNNQQVIYHTAEAQEVVYEAPAKYDPNITINKPIQQTIINSDVNISDTVMDDIIRSTMKGAGNSNINIQINNGNIGSNNGFMSDPNNFSDISTFNLNQTNIINNINNISGGNDYNPNLNFDLNSMLNSRYNNDGLNFDMNSNNIDVNSSNDDILRKTAGIGSHNFPKTDDYY